MATIVHLHGLESTVDHNLVPVGGKAAFLSARFDVDLVPLDTSEAVRIAHREWARSGTWSWPYDGYEDAFAVPLARARAAITADTRVVMGSSFGGAVLLRLLHEDPVWRGPSIFLAGAGPKLTPHTTLPEGVPCLLVHGTRDEVVPFSDSERLAATSASAERRPVDDRHSLGSLLEGPLADCVAWALGRAR